jgi:hypothetical protein
MEKTGDKTSKQVFTYKALFAFVFTELGVRALPISSVFSGLKT